MNEFINNVYAYVMTEECINSYNNYGALTVCSGDDMGVCFPEEIEED